MNNNNNNSMMSVTEAALYLKMDRHNVFKKIKEGTLVDAGMHVVVGTMQQRYVTTDSVEAYEKIMRRRAVGIQLYKMKVPDDLYEAVCKGKATPNDLERLRGVFIKAENVTVSSRLYHQAKKGGTNASDLALKDLDDRFDDDDDTETEVPKKEAVTEEAEEVDDTEEPTTGDIEDDFEDEEE